MISDRRKGSRRAANHLVEDNALVCIVNPSREHLEFDGTRLYNHLNGKRHNTNLYGAGLEVVSIGEAVVRKGGEIRISMVLTTSHVRDAFSA